MAKKFHYFNLNGLGESIRYILHYGGEKFEDVRYEFADWPSKKDATPFGQLPYYEENGKALNQSLAIARYLAAKVKLLPSDPWQQALLDAAVLNVYDFWAKAKPYILEQDPAKKKEIKNQVLGEVVPYFFDKFEEQLKSNNGFLGSQLSWADFILVGIVECANLFFKESVEKNHPYIIALVKKIHSLPGVKEYVASRKPYVYE